MSYTVLMFGEKGIRDLSSATVISMLYYAHCQQPCVGCAIARSVDGYEEMWRVAINSGIEGIGDDQTIKTESMDIWGGQKGVGWRACIPAVVSGSPGLVTRGSPRSVGMTQRKRQSA